MKPHLADLQRSLLYLHVSSEIRTINTGSLTLFPGQGWIFYVARKTSSKVFSSQEYWLLYLMRRDTWHAPTPQRNQSPCELHAQIPQSNLRSDTLSPTQSRAPPLSEPLSYFLAHWNSSFHLLTALADMYCRTSGILRHLINWIKLSCFTISWPMFRNRYLFLDKNFFPLYICDICTFSCVI